MGRGRAHLVGTADLDGVVLTATADPCGTGATGALLVRPDLVVAWRPTGSIADPGSVVAAAAAGAATGRDRS